MAKLLPHPWMVALTEISLTLTFLRPAERRTLSRPPSILLQWPLIMTFSTVGSSTWITIWTRCRLGASPWSVLSVPLSRPFRTTYRLVLGTGSRMGSLSPYLTGIFPRWVLRLQRFVSVLIVGPVYRAGWVLSSLSLHRSRQRPSLLSRLVLARLETMRRRRWKLRCRWWARLTHLCSLTQWWDLMFSSRPLWLSRAPWAHLRVIWHTLHSSRKTFSSETDIVSIVTTTTWPSRMIDGLSGT